jgi:predicted O-linked N-acetylglucosamine transferase (SPINDLY family)
LVYTSPQPVTWAAYGAVDIALDPFPHNAGTTTIEALWQGVPVLTLAGRPTVGRFGAAILHAVGLNAWVTDDAETYVTRAVAAAADLEALAALRADLRPRVAVSPLRDADGLAREVEAAYRRLWQQWCDDDSDVRQLYAAGDGVGAARLAESRLARDPCDAAALHVLGLIRYSQGDARTAIQLLQHSADAAGEATVLSDLGVLLRAAGRLREAEAAYRRALETDPSLVQALGNMGNVLLDQHRPIEAQHVLRQALHHTPDQAWLLRSLALSHIALGETEQAETALRQALAIHADDTDAHDTLGALLGHSGRPLEAEAHHRAALPHSAQPHRVLSNLAIALQTQGRHSEAERCCREALTTRPDYAVAHSNLLFSLNYREDLTPQAIFAEYRRWDAQHAAPLAPTMRPAPQPHHGRRLRVGYVSADFRQHAVAWFAEPLLAAHDRTHIELFCYSGVTIPDAITDRFRTLAEHWRITVGLDDATLAETIRRDGIDVLVDLGGHTAASRLLMFARRPAPVQVSYLLGHGYSSGMSEMDAFLADAELAPPGADALFSERLIRLPRIPLAYAAPDAMPDVAQLPGLREGRLTYGYFGRMERLNETVIATWARILREAPGSRLMLNSLPLREPAFRDLIAARFAAHDISADRLAMVATAPQPATWSAYGDVDVALDPFPHNAGTTTIEALWQGVPVVTLTGRPSVGRFGTMILRAVGMGDWVNEDTDSYVRCALQAATDVKRLAALRAGLRSRVAASPLCDAAGLARDVEAAYRMLRDAC